MISVVLNGRLFANIYNYKWMLIYLFTTINRKLVVVCIDIPSRIEAARIVQN